MWGRKAAAPVHALHFGFGLGAVLAPQIARPFISSKSHSSEILSNTTTNASLTEDIDKAENPIHIPYMISAVYTFTFSVTFLIYFILERKHKNIITLLRKEKRPDPPSWKTLLNPGSCAGGDTFFSIRFFILIFIFYFNIVGGERAYGKFIFSYAREGKPGFSVGEATTLNSVFWICFTVGRGVATIMARWCPLHILLFIELGLNILCSICLAIWGYSIHLILWIFSGVLGFVLSPVFPACLAWANLYVVMKGLAVAIVFIGSATGGMVYQWLTGYLFEYHGPEMLMYVMLGYAVFLTCVYVILFCVGRHHGQRFTDANSRECEMNENTKDHVLEPLSTADTQLKEEK